MLNCFKYFLIYILGHFVSKNQTRKILNYIKSLYAKLCQIFFNICFATKCLKSQASKILSYIKSPCIIFCVKMARYSQKFLNYITSLCDKTCQYFQIVYTPKALFRKNRLYFLFFIFWHAEIPPSFRILHYWH